MPRPTPLLTLLAGLTLAACTPSGGGSRSDCREADNACAGGFICAAIALDTYECRQPCSDGLCPIGERCDPFSNACVPGDAPPADRGPSDRGPGDAGPASDTGPGGDGAVATDARPPDATIAHDQGPVHDAALDAATLDVGFDFGHFDFGAELDFGRRDAELDFGHFDAELDFGHFDAELDFGHFDAELDFGGADGGQAAEVFPGDWRVELLLPSDNPLPLLVRMTVGDRSPVFEAVRNRCGDAPCEDGQAGAWQPLGLRTNDVELFEVDGALVVSLFGGLGLGVEGSPLGVDVTLSAFDFVGEQVQAGRLCGSAFVRLLIDGQDPVEAEVPARLQYIEQWFPFRPDLGDIIECRAE